MAKDGIKDIAGEVADKVKDAIANKGQKEQPDGGNSSDGDSSD